MQPKGKKQVIDARMSDKAVKSAKDKLKNQIKRIQKPKNNRDLYQKVNIYNSMVMGIQNYYGIANNVTLNLHDIQRYVNTAMKNRLEWKKSGEIRNSYLAKRYGKSKQVRWISGMPLIPIGYYKSKNPMHKRSTINQYTPEGREEIYKQPDILFIEMMHYIMRNPVQERSIEYNDNRISLYMAQLGRCAVSEYPLEIGKMHCHHKLPVYMGGGDEYGNLIFVTETVHRLIHATEKNAISNYLKELNLEEKQLKKLNQLRRQAGLEEVKYE